MVYIVYWYIVVVCNLHQKCIWSVLMYLLKFVPLPAFSDKYFLCTNPHYLRSILPDQASRKDEVSLATHAITKFEPPPRPLKYSGLPSIYYVCSYRMKNIAVKEAYMNLRHYWRFTPIKPQWHFPSIDVFVQVLYGKFNSQGFVWELFRMWFFSVQLNKKQGCVAVRDCRAFLAIFAHDVGWNCPLNRELTFFLSSPRTRHLFHPLKIPTLKDFAW